MRVLILASAASLACSAWARSTEAIDKLQQAIDRAVTALVTFIMALVYAAMDRVAPPSAFAFADGSALQPGMAFYDAPPQSEIRHESLVSHRSAARHI